MKKGNPVLAVIIFAVMAVAVFTIARHAYAPVTPSDAVASDSGSGTSAIQANPVAADVPVPTAPALIGELTVTVTDEGGNNVTVSGTTVKIVNDGTKVTYTQAVDNGKLVFDLPLGDYSVTQQTAANGYAVDTGMYKFSLALPSDAGANVQVVRANVVLVNEKASSAESAQKTGEAVIINPITGDPVSVAAVIATVIVLCMILAALVFVMRRLKSNDKFKK